MVGDQPAIEGSLGTVLLVGGADLAKRLRRDGDHEAATTGFREAIYRAQPDAQSGSGTSPDAAFASSSTISDTLLQMVCACGGRCRAGCLRWRPFLGQ